MQPISGRVKRPAPFLFCFFSAKTVIYTNKHKYFHLFIFPFMHYAKFFRNRKITLYFSKAIKYNADS